MPLRGGGAGDRGARAWKSDGRLPALGDHLATVMQFFYASFEVQKDVEVRLDFFALLSNVYA